MSPTQEETQEERMRQVYFERLMSQDTTNICPDCVARGERKHLCAKPVLLLINDDWKLVCCYLGDRDELSREEFCKKVDELKAAATIVP